MIELKFYRDDEYVYINNPDGTTKRVAIEDFESAVSGEGGSGGNSVFVINRTYDESISSYKLDKTLQEITTQAESKVCVVICYENNDESEFFITDIVTNVTISNDESAVYTINGSSDQLYITKYANINGVLVEDSVKGVPPFSVGFTVSNTEIYSNPLTVYNALSAMLSTTCYFNDVESTQNRNIYTALSYGYYTSGSNIVYYVELSNGKRYEGLESNNSMTVVTT